MSATAKFTVVELAKMMGKPAKEVLFLLQGIGVDVKSVESVLDPSTAQSILTGKTQAPKSLIVRQAAAPSPAAIAAAAARQKTERAALKRIKIVQSPAEGEADVTGVATAEPAEAIGSAAAPVEGSPTLEAPTVTVAVAAGVEPPPAPRAPETKAEPVSAPMAIVTAPVAVAAPAANAPPEAAKSAADASAAPAPVTAPAAEVTPVPAPAVTAVAAEASVPAAPQAVEAKEAKVAAPPAPSPAPSVPAAPAPTAPAGPPTPRRPMIATPPRSGAAAPHRPGTGLAPRGATASPRSAPMAAMPKQAPRPLTARDRILQRTGGELTRPGSSTTPPSSSAPPPPSSMYGDTTPSSASAGPHSPGVKHLRSIPPAPPTPAGGPAPSGPSPIRGAGGLGRAVIAAPTPATTRPLIRPSAPPSSMPQRPMTPGRPGFPPRPGGPGMSPRPAFGRGPMAPNMPPATPLLPTDKRRKDAAKPGSTVVRKDDAKKGTAKRRTKEVSALEEDVRDYLGTYKADTYEDIGPVEIGEDGLPILKVLSKSAQRKAGKKTMSNDAGNVVEVKKGVSSGGPVFLSEGVTVKELSDKIGILAKDLMKSFLSRGVFATINQPVDPKVAIEIAKEFGIEAAIVSFEEEMELSRQQSVLDQKAISDAKGGPDTAAAAPGVERTPRAPVVTVMGHVDHGKTSLLDAIRKAKVAEGEAGGITQHMGAYQVEVKGKRIVFLDTPGHEAFTMMRARGAKATDIVVLVVAADDGVMPQTQEAIDHAKAARVPMVVAINKIDKPDANPQKVKQELAEKSVLVEEFGGEVVACEISAKKKIGIDQLLEMILLQAEVLELKAVATGPARGVVLEARREAGKGTLATVLVQQGTLKIGDVFFAGAAVGRVRAMLDDDGNRIESAGPSTPVEVMGFEDLPNSGDALQVVEDEQKARQVSSFRSQKEREESLTKSSRMSLDSLFTRMKQGEAKDLALIVKADVHGSEEVLIQSLHKLSTEKVKVSVLHSGVGAISVNDVLLASASEAIIIGFNVRPEKKAQELADKEGVDIRLYSVIYTLTDEIKKAMTGLLDFVKKEVAKGKAEVRDTFKVPKIGVIGGCMVTEGVIPRTASVRLVRDSRVIYEGKIGSLRRFKDDASEVKSGFECGIGIAGYQDLKVGDVIEAYVIEEVVPTL